MRTQDLPTPCALVDLDRLERNCKKMGEKIARLGAKLRPHVKTHKCAEIAKLQTRGHFGGITVSMLAEARAFSSAGFRDITYAVPIAPSRLADAAGLLRTGVRLSLLLDSAAMLREIEKCAGAQGNRFPVFLKVDCGYRRAGVNPARAESVELAASMASSPHIEFAGLLTHAGHAYRARDREEAAEVAWQERTEVARFAAQLREAGVNVPEVSVGSTPTMTACESLEGVTEARPGNYAFFDAFQVAIGSCSVQEVAFSVLATVIGVYPDRRELLVDAGALALSKDPGPVHVDPQCGFGLIFSEDGLRFHPTLKLVSLTQEHGQVRVAEPARPEEFRIGSRVRIFPNHSCLAAACFDRYFALRGPEVVDEWKPCRGW
jgi:D-serine deaminase-like pyridoxal phosphate-dependent protein